jgi:hypothetical protein
MPPGAPNLPLASGRKTRQRSLRRQLDEKRTRLQSPSGARGSQCAALRCAPQPRVSTEEERDGGSSARWKAPESTSCGRPCVPRLGLAVSIYSYTSLVTDHLQHLCVNRVFFLLRWSLTNYTILNGRKPSRERHDDLDDSDDNVVQKEEKFICNRQVRGRQADGAAKASSLAAPKAESERSVHPRKEASSASTRAPTPRWRSCTSLLGQTRDEGRSQEQPISA